MMRKQKFVYCLLLLLSQFNVCLAQFPPAAGQPGTSAMHKDSSAFIDWVSGCKVIRGLQNITTASAGYVSAGDSTQAFGMAGSNGVVSLGDAGEAICSFWNPIANGPGFDFAVFENSFSDDFLELAFVEVSNDGINFFRFPATSFIQDTIQIGTFDTAGIPEKINNLAGKYRALYGTPFDLQELSGTPGLDINFITHIKIVDVIGNISDGFCSYDQYGNKVNDPWPTEFSTGGFDLDAIGVIHNWTNSINEKQNSSLVEFYPNPANNQLNVIASENTQVLLTICDINGRPVLSEKIIGNHKLDISHLNKGLYFIRTSTNEGEEKKARFIKQ